MHSLNYPDYVFWIFTVFISFAILLYSRYWAKVTLFLSFLLVIFSGSNFPDYKYYFANYSDIFATGVGSISAEPGYNLFIIYWLFS